MISQLLGNGWTHHTTTASVRPPTPARSLAPGPSTCSIAVRGDFLSASSRTITECEEPATKKQRLDIGGHSRIIPLNSTAQSQNASNGVPASSGDTAQHREGGKAPALAKFVSRKTPTISNAEEADARPSLPFPPPPNAVESKKTYIPQLPLQIKPYKPEVAVLAPRYENESLADFHPWRGDHPEDVLNELTCKNGHYDRLQSGTGSESTTARPSIWSSLMHKSGPQVLSSLLGSTLGQRQLYGTIASTSTFKPPPRVTLTDAKRESWLKDLANWSITLRRLSRTIPHGIRGKILLDHCLNKNIPVPRAVWLAKCVGANEIRAFKRKGTAGAFTAGGEIKWVKEWTASVEQFTEGCMKLREPSDRAARITYGLRLTSGLFAHRLIDEEHYLDWIVHGIRNTGIDTLPVWLLMVKMHLDELCAQRRRGGKVVVSLLKNFHHYNTSPDRHLYSLAIDLMKDALKETILKSPSCMIISPSQQSYLLELRDSIKDDSVELQRTLDDIIRRNNALSSPLASVSNMGACKRQHHFVELLDSIGTNSDMRQVFKECREVVREHPSLVRTTLEWGSSIYRPRMATRYLAIRLLRYCARAGTDLTPHVLKLIGASSNMPGLDEDKLYHILADLFRSKHLAVSQYLQWLIASGTEVNDHGGSALCKFRLLLEIPLVGLPVHVINLRGALLRKFGASLQEEAERIAKLKMHITEGLEKPTVGGTGSLTATKGHRLPHTIRSDIALWIRGLVLSDRLYSQKERPSEQSKAELEQQSQVHGKVRQLRNIIRLLRNLGDFPILADVLHSFVFKGREELLLEAVECVNLHYETFAAIGAATDLFYHLAGQIQPCHPMNKTTRYLVESIFDLASRVPFAIKAFDKLQHASALLHRQHSVVASSPVSDHVTDALLSTEDNFTEELEQALAAGTSMDVPTMKQLLDLIMDRFEASWASSKGGKEDFTELLQKLRSFDADAFDVMFNDRLQRLLLSSSRPDLCGFIPSFVASRCTTLDRVFTLILRSLQPLQDQQQCPGLATAAYELLTVSECEYDQAQYGVRHLHRFFDQQHKLAMTAVPSMRVIVSTVHKYSRALKGLVSDQSVESPDIERFRRLISTVALQQPDALQEFWGVTQRSPVALALLKLRKMEHVRRTASDSPSAELEDLLAASDDFNVPIVQSQLQALFSTSSTGFTSQLINAIIDQYILFRDRDHASCSKIISSLGEKHTGALQQEVELRLLNRLPDELAAADEGDLDTEVTVLLAMVVNSNTRLDVNATSTVVKKALDTFASALTIWKYHGSSAGSRKLERVISLQLSVLALHLPSIDDPAFPQPLLHSAITILSILLTTNSPVSSLPGISKQLNDLLIVLSDFLHDDTRIQLLRTRHTFPTPNDPRLDYIFGTSEPTVDGWLQLVSNTKSHLPSSAPRKSSGVLKQTTKLFHIRHWEMMQDATPVMGENDASLCLTLLGARKAII